MEKDVVCLLKCPWYGGCLAITVLTVISVWCPLFKMVCPWKKINTCVSEYTISNSACASWRWTSCFWTSGQFCFVLWRRRQCFFKERRTAAIRLQEMQTTCQAQAPPIIRSQKASSVTSSGISYFEKIRQNIWHQSYNSGIYYTTPWKWHFALENKNATNSLNQSVISHTAKDISSKGSTLPSDVTRKQT